MSKRTGAGEYLAISTQALNAAVEAARTADHAAQAGDVPAAEAAAKDAGEQATICEQAWEALEAYRKGRATDFIAKAKTNYDAAADSARLAADFVKTARRIAEEKAATETQVFDQEADTETGALVGAVDAALARLADTEPDVIEGEIVDAGPDHVDAPGMPPALDLAGLAIPDASAAFPWPADVRGLTLDVADRRTGFAEVDARPEPEPEDVDPVAEAQKAAEAAELHTQSAKAAAAEGDASGARVSAMLAHGAANRAQRFADVADGNGNPAAMDARGWAGMAAEYAAAAKDHAQEAADYEARAAAEAAQDAAADAEPVDVEPAEANRPPEDVQPAPEALEAPETAGDVQEAPEGVQAAPVAAEDDFRPAGVHAERIGPRHTFRQLRPGPAKAPAPDAVLAADLAAITDNAGRDTAETLAAAALGEQGRLWDTPTETVQRLADRAAQAAAEAQHWAERGHATASRKLAVKAGYAAEAATLFAADHEPDDAELAVYARRARAWADAATRAAVAALNAADAETENAAE